MNGGVQTEATHPAAAEQGFISAGFNPEKDIINENSNPVDLLYFNNPFFSFLLKRFLNCRYSLGILYKVILSSFDDWVFCVIRYTYNILGLYKSFFLKRFLKTKFFFGIFY